MVKRPRPIVLRPGKKGLEEVCMEEDYIGEEDGGGGFMMSDELNTALASSGHKHWPTHIAKTKVVEDDDEYDEYEDDDDDDTRRTHPLTAPNRFTTSPSTLNLPPASFVDPATALLSGMPPVHLADTAHRIFGGIGLPYSTSTPAILKTMQARPIALDAQQAGMSDIEADVYMAAVMPAVLASVQSTLVETRKRLGGSWLRNLVKKAESGELRVLDAGGAGAGILAVREVLRAEWESMLERGEVEGAVSSTMAMAEADGKVGGAGVSAPVGSATVLVGADTLRKRASQLLDNTTFIPRLPDYIHSSAEASQKGKFDIIIAPHTLWPLREDYLRRSHVQNLWGMLASDGGVLLLLEKGVPRGFEMVAGARDLLLDTRIASPGLTDMRDLDIDSPLQPPEIDWEDDGTGAAPASEARPVSRGAQKETGMIIAPCTNHTGCPMYTHKGVLKGRKDICHFEQRYIRPPFLQSILKARDKNYEDVKFSYLSVMRGRDLRSTKSTTATTSNADADFTFIVQGQEATDLAFDAMYTEANDAASGPNALTLPRTVLPPMKRRGHVILDLCTSAGNLERWTVPRSYSKLAYRDARKSRWGDLWALGAKTRVPHNVRAGDTSRSSKQPADADMDVKLVKIKGGKKGKNCGYSGDGTFEASGKGLGLDEYGRIVEGGGMQGEKLEGGKMRGRKVGGVRDKRDKKGLGNGRVKRRMEE